MRFHLVDRIDTLEPWTRIEAVKRTSSSEKYWATDDSGHQYMPLPIQLEVLAQSAAWLVYLSTDRKHRAVLLSVGAALARSRVGPGDDILAAADIRSAGDTIVVSGHLRVGDRTVLEVEDLMCALIDADVLEDAASVRDREEILRSGERS
ncbi:hypothetical protein AB0H76_04110 [Nocardia sp. NPDC050712]|uniref:hypothetical protein n=1 Tax=Nocardia sp. NPDC050712 TaxID=3155518 RepID=UPI0033CE51C6